MNHTIESTIVNRAMDEMRRELRACPGFDVWLQVDNDNQHNIALTAHCVCVCEGKGEGQRECTPHLAVVWRRLLANANNIKNKCGKKLSSASELANKTKLINGKVH